MWNTTLFFNYFLGWGTRKTFEVDKDEGFYQGTHKTFVDYYSTTPLLLEEKLMNRVLVILTPL